MLLVRAFLQILIVFLNLYYVILLIRVLITWFPIDRYNPIVKTLFALTEPLLEPIRSIMPRTGALDLSPLVAMLLIFFLQRALAVLAAGF